jgi:putative lipoic acid-binding regulatory protein
MKKDKFDLANLNLPQSMEMKKTGEGTQALVEKAIKVIHHSEEESKKSTVSIGLKRVVVDISSDLYKAMKIHIAEDDVSMRDYIAHLIQKEINSRNK